MIINTTALINDLKQLRDRYRKLPSEIHVHPTTIDISSYNEGAFQWRRNAADEIDAIIREYETPPSPANAGIDYQGMPHFQS